MKFDQKNYQVFVKFMQACAWRWMEFCVEMSLDAVTVYKIVYHFSHCNFWILELESLPNKIAVITGGNRGKWFRILNI